MSAVACDVASFADFIQYYQDHYVLSRTNPNLMYYIAGADGGRRNIATRVRVVPYVNGVRGDDMSMSEAQVMAEMNWGLPQIGMTVVQDELLYMYYRTARNGGRGYDPLRVLSHSFNGHILSANNLEVLTLGRPPLPATVWATLKPKWVSLAEAMDDFNSTSAPPNKIAYALSWQFGVYLSHKEHPTLCYKMLEIGDVIDPNSVQLYPKYSEYKDLIRRVLNPELEITVK